MQALLGHAAALDAAVAGGRGAVLAASAVTLGTTLAGQGAAYAKGVVSDFNEQRRLAEAGFTHPVLGHAVSDERDPEGSFSLPSLNSSDGQGLPTMCL